MAAHSTPATSGQVQPGQQRDVGRLAAQEVGDLLVGLPDEEERALGARVQQAGEFDEVPGRPVLLRAAAARMQQIRLGRGAAGGQQRGAARRVGRTQAQARRGALRVEGEPLQRLHEVVHRVLRFHQGRAVQDVARPRLGQVRAHHAVRIVQVAQHEVERADEGLLLGRKLGAQREEARRLRAVQRRDAIRKSGGHGEVRDVGVGQQFDVAIRPAFAQGLQRGQGHDEVADRAAAQDEDAGRGGDGRMGVGGCAQYTEKPRYSTPREPAASSRPVRRRRPSVSTSGSIQRRNM
jgi:hypothetical protein